MIKKIKSYLGDISIYVYDSAHLVMPSFVKFISFIAIFALIVLGIPKFYFIALDEKKITEFWLGLFGLIFTMVFGLSSYLDRRQKDRLQNHKEKREILVIIKKAIEELEEVLKNEDNDVKKNNKFLKVQEFCSIEFFYKVQASFFDKGLLDVIDKLQNKLNDCDNANVNEIINKTLVLNDLHFLFLNLENKTFGFNFKGIRKLNSKYF